MSIHTALQYLPPFLDGLAGWGLLLLRLVFGSAMIAAGIPKIKAPLHWMDQENELKGMPLLKQGWGAWVIFGGGIVMLLGLLTPLAAVGLAISMAVALGIHLKNGASFTKPPNIAGETYEASLVYLAIAILFLFLGPGIFSIDSLLVQLL